MSALPKNVTPLNIPSHPDAEIVVVTPDLAKRWLGYNVRNRTLRDRYVARYARDMASDNWKLTGEAIKFDTNGALLDGQHRLAAVIKSGVAVPFLVVRGLASESQDHMDTGNARTAADMLSINSHTNAAALAAAARLALGVEHGDIDRYQPTHAEVREFVEANPTLIESVEFTRGLARRTDCPPAVVAYSHWRLAQIDAIEAANFWLGAAEKAGLRAGDPVIALTNRFAEARRNRETLSRRIYLSLIYRAWNTRRAGKTMRYIRVNSPAGGLVPIPEPK